MLTVLIETKDHEDPLARTLASLVPGAVEGVVRDVIVHDRGSSDRTELVAEHAGCTFVRGGDLAGAIGRARGEWILILEPGAVLESNWIEAVMQHTSLRAEPARFSRARGSWPGLFARLFGAGHALADGFLVNKSQALTRVRSGEELESMARGLAGRRLAACISRAATDSRAGA